MISSIRWALPCSNNIQEEQTQCSLTARVIACALGVIALTLGIFILAGMPGLYKAGFVVGGLLTSIGGVLLLAGGCIKSVKSISPSKEHPTTSTSKEHPTKQQVQFNKNSYSNFDIAKSQCDITGDKTITNIDIDEYMKVLVEHHPTFMIPQWGTETRIVDQENNVNRTVKKLLKLLTFRKNAAKQTLAFHLFLSGPGWKHYTLVFIDLTKRTVEFYDNVVKSANHQEVLTTLTEVAKTFSEKIPATSPFTLECPITKPLLGNGNDCGVWVMYFLENRLNNPHIDFNHITLMQEKEIMKDFRERVTQKLIEREMLVLQRLEEIRKQQDSA